MHLTWATATSTAYCNQSSSSKQTDLLNILEATTDSRRKESVDSQAKELQALEARLRDTEELLKERQSRGPSSVGRNNEIESLNSRQPLGNASGGQENGRLESSSTYPHATQAPSSQSVSASTLAHWRPAQNTASGTDGGGAPFARPSGQENSGYVK